PLAAKGWDPALGRYAGAGQRDGALRSREQLSASLDAHSSPGVGAANTSSRPYWRRMEPYASVAASVGNGTHGEAASSRMETTWKTRNLSADLPFSWSPGTWSTAT